MPDLPANRPPSLVARSLAWLARAAGVADASPAEFRAGYDYASGSPVSPDYRALDSLSAFAAFAWVQACVSAVAEDLSGLPIRVLGDDTPEAEALPRHPLLLLLEAPSSGTSGLALRRQLVTDLRLTGNAFVLLVAGARGSAPALYRLHPERTRPVPGPSGEAIAYDYTGEGTQRYDRSVVYHVRTSSWSDDPRSLLGTGAIEALHQDLTTDLELSRRMASAAKAGRPEAIAVPKGDAGTAYGPEATRAIADSIARAFRARDGGVAVVGKAIEITPIAWAPKDLGLLEQRDSVRDRVLAVLGVPPTRVGLPTANYATSQQQSQTYWQGLRGFVALIDAELTRLARALDGGSRVVVRHDFAGVPALQYDRTERLQRVVTWVGLGADPDEATAYEGLLGAPALEGLIALPPAATTPAPPAQPAPMPEDDAARSWWDDVAQDGQTLTRSWEPPGVTEEERAATWRGYLDGAIGPGEIRIGARVQRWQRAARRRIAEAVRASEAGPVGVTRAALTIDDVFPADAEGQALREAIGDEIAVVLARAFQLAARRMGLAMSWDDVRRAEQSILAELVSRVTETTRAEIGQALVDGLASGDSIAELSIRLQRVTALGPSRAVTIARTETTRAVSSGSVEAMASAARLGVVVRKQWLSARDSAVRDDHRELDGQEAEVGGSFGSNGHHAAAPGGFGVAELDINCRCTVVPIVEET